MVFHRTLLLMSAVWWVVGCATTDSEPPRAVDSQSKPVVMFNLTSDARADPHPMTMALQLARHAIDDGRHVVLFFNVKSIHVVSQDFPPDLANSPAPPIRQLLADVMAAGAEVQVCPHCLKAIGLNKSQLIPGAKLTSRDALFSRIGPDTVVFTY